MKRLRLYHRLDCHLCEDMAIHLEALREDWLFDLERIDVDSDASLRARYNSRIPLLEDADGNCLSEYYLDQERVLRYLQDA